MVRKRCVGGRGAVGAGVDVGTDAGSGPGPDDSVAEREDMIGKFWRWLIWQLNIEKRMESKTRKLLESNSCSGYHRVIPQSP